MPSKQTQNYHLSQWVKTDKVLMDDFNADNAAIDAAIKAVEDSKADRSALTSLQTSTSSDLSSLRTAMSGKGNCRIWTKTYTGDGSYGAKTPNSITFPAKPAIVIIGEHSNIGSVIVATYGQTIAYLLGSIAASCAISWSGSTMSWYAGTHATAQMNSNGFEYGVVALIAES